MATFHHNIQNRVINLHPALPGTFPGTHAVSLIAGNFSGYQAVGSADEDAQLTSIDGQLHALIIE